MWPFHSLINILTWSRRPVLSILQSRGVFNLWKNTEWQEQRIKIFSVSSIGSVYELRGLEDYIYEFKRQWIIDIQLFYPL